ncbi:hypothetical protein PFICI_08410 [Pestalotiopsis fici W106-1]|uniref:Major facilitator superfamily (MFS) profile domain-containing protein n=1 Tax=Pestalotiopsis fici (strain W106-1 / CGMCC3.15140) TaxID=1229662 RepID=W3X6R9_PESFW|nr:uncharacterized protein PFICI_08410 [Pestalotiopsis fici W106-1]ETS80881.1 hypothetical protein PFICI_08410 [Pestalotiopsis fici W106-1]
MILGTAHEEHAEAGETRPLLLSSTERAATSAPSEARSPTHRSRCSWPWTHVVGLVLCIAILADLGESMFMAPRMRLYESVICSEFFSQADPSLIGPDGTVPEKMCKVTPVQEQLATLLGWQSFIDSIPAILLPIPFCYLADKYGRKWIMALGLIGFTLSYAWAELVVASGLRLQYVLLSSVFYLIGGGPTTATTLLTTVVTDVVPPELRATVFLYRFCPTLVADLVVPPITAALMAKDVWIPLLLSVALQGFGALLVILTVPETLPILILENNLDERDNPRAEEPNGAPDKGQKLTQRLVDWTRDHIASFSFVTRHASIWSLVFTFLISKLGRQSSNVLFQYVSKRYDWSLGQAGLLISVQAAVSLALYMAILPAIATFVLSSFSVTSKDLLLAKGSIVLSVLGAVVITLSATPALMIIGVVLFTFGSGFAPSVRSLVTSLVEQHDVDGSSSDVGRLYALISAMEGIGSLVAAPGMAWAFRYGMSLGEEWLGLPFGLATALFALVLIIVFSVRIPEA